KREARSELPGPSDEGSEVVTGSLPEPYPEPSGNLPEESAKNPRPHGDVHVQLHGDVHVQRRAQDARPAPAGKPKPKKQPRPAKPAKPKPPAFDALAVPLPDFVSHEAWTDFVEHRQQLKKPLTERAAELILKDLAKTPLEADRMLRR